MQKSTTTTPEEHIASLPDDVRADIATLDGAIAAAMPGEERVVWEGKFWGGTEQRIIGYGSYHYKGRSGAEGDWSVIGLAAQKNYLSEVYGTRLGKVKAKRGNIQLKRASDVDLDVLREMAARARELTLTT